MSDFDTLLETVKEALSELRDALRISAAGGNPDTAQVLRRQEAALEALASLRATLERVEALVPLWLQQQAEYPANEVGSHAAAAVRVCARELTRALQEGD